MHDAITATGRKFLFTRRNVIKTHHVYTTQRADLWDAHRTDRDRTTERIELGVSTYDYLRAENRK